MNKQGVIDYVMNSPQNTNPAVLSGMLDDISGGGSTDKTVGTFKHLGDEFSTGYDNNMQNNCTEFTFPNTIRKISDYSFSSWNALEKVVIPEGVTTIGQSCFTNCKKLTEIEIPESVTSIGASCFQTCGFKKFEWPENVTEIPSQVFSSCADLEELIIPEGITIIGNSIAYQNNESRKLTEIILPSTITTINSSAFYEANITLKCRFSEGVVEGAPWGATGEVIYDYTGE